LRGTDDADIVPCDRASGMGDDGGGLVAAKISVPFSCDAVRRRPRPPLFEALESRRLLSGVGAPSSTSGLVDTFLTTLPAAVLPGASGTVGLRIANLGPGAANGNFRISLLATTDGTIASTVATVKTVIEQLNLPVGGHADSTLGFTYPSSLASGTYQFIAVVNFAGAVSQTNASYQLVTIAPPFVHLSAYFTQAPPFATINRIPVEGLSMLVANSGNQRAAGKITVSLYESPTPTLGASPILLETFSNILINIRANGSERVTLVQKKIPRTAVIGDEYLIGVMNSTAGRQQSTVAAPFPTSFSTAQFIALPGTITVGNTIPISVVVTNAQATAIKGRVNITVYQSPGSTVDPLTALLETFSNLPINIPANGTQTFTLNLKIPVGAALGNQFLLAALTPVAPLASNQNTDTTIASLAAITFVK
jgi:hypothetical protein